VCLVVRRPQIGAGPSRTRAGESARIAPSALRSQPISAPESADLAGFIAVSAAIGQRPSRSWSGMARLRPEFAVKILDRRRQRAREVQGLPDDITPYTFRKSSRSSSTTRRYPRASSQTCSDMPTRQCPSADTCAAERSTTRPPRSSTPGRTQCSFEPLAYAATEHQPRARIRPHQNPFQPLRSERTLSGNRGARRPGLTRRGTTVRKASVAAASAPRC